MTLNLLYATDGSEHALGAARFLARLPHSEKTHLHLLTVRPLKEREEPDGEGERILKEARAALEAYSGTLTEAVRYAEPGTQHTVAAIVEEAKSRNVDLIVVGKCGLSPITRFFLGSVAEGVVRCAPCPVLAAVPMVGEMFDRVLMGFDGSEDACTAAAWLPHLPLSDDCSLRLLSVVLPRPMFTGGAGVALLASGMDVDELVERDKRRIAASQEAMGRKLAEQGVACRILCEIAEDREPASALVSAARGKEADLIVVGSRGITGAEHLLLGSVSEQVLRSAPCSVLIIRANLQQKDVR